ncbi:MAG: ABC transporter permease [Lentisphaerales bacterium]|nr:ABC transporter permease [Lentisphaerales bacterium]
MKLSGISSNKEFIFTGRVLLQASRSPQTYITRTVLAVLLTAILSSFVDSGIFSGMMAFQILVSINFIFYSMYSCIIFSSMIASERESGTLGLLMLTPRHPLSLIAAKSVPIFSEILNGLLIQLPIFIMCIAHGGVDPQQIPQIMLLLTIQVILLGSIGVVVSCLGVSFKNAAGLTIVCGLLFFFGPGLLDLFQYKYLPQTASWNLFKKSVTYNNVLILAGIFNFQDLIPNIVTSAILTLCIAVLLLYLSTKMLEKLNLSTTADLGKNKDKSKTKKRKRIWGQALIGKDYLLNGGRKMVILKALFYPIGSFLLYRQLHKSGTSTNNALPITCALLYLAFLTELIVYTSMAFVYETKDKQMSSILMLPKSNMEILKTKYKAALFFSLIPLFYGVLITLFNPQYFGNFLKLLHEPGSYIALSIYLTILFTIAHSNLIKTMKKNAAGQIKKTIAMFAFYYFGIRPLTNVYDYNPWLCSFIVAIAAIVYIYYTTRKIDRDMTTVAQQEN